MTVWIGMGQRTVHLKMSKMGPVRGFRGSKHGADGLNLISRTHVKKKLGVGACICNPRPPTVRCKAEAGESEEKREVPKSCPLPSTHVP